MPKHSADRPYSQLYKEGMSPEMIEAKLGIPSGECKGCPTPSGTRRVSFETRLAQELKRSESQATQDMLRTNLPH